MIRLSFLVSIIVCGVVSQIVDQDYFVVIKKNDNRTFRYPSNVVINLFDEKGNKTFISKDDTISVDGNYSLEIDVPWSDKNDIIESDGGLLEVFVLPKSTDDPKVIASSVHKLESNQSPQTNDRKPKIEKKDVSPSKKNIDHYNLLLVFDNDITFKYEDGNVRAWENGDEIKVTN